MRCSICCLSSCFLWRFRRCHRHRPFRRALGRPCAAPPYKGHAVLPSLSSAFLCARRHRRNLESRRSLRHTGRRVLLCQFVCAGVCQRLWPHRHCRQHHRAEFRIFHLLLHHRLRPNRHHLHQPKPCGRAACALQKNPTALPSAPSSCFAALSAACLLPIRLLFKAPASVFCVSCFFEPVCNLYEIPAGALRAPSAPRRLYDRGHLRVSHPLDLHRLCRAPRPFHAVSCVPALLAVYHLPCRAQRLPCPPLCRLESAAPVNAPLRPAFLCAAARFSGKTPGVCFGVSPALPCKKTAYPCIRVRRFSFVVFCFTGFRHWPPFARPTAYFPCPQTAAPDDNTAPPPKSAAL